MSREFHSLRVEAIVIKHYDSGEADRILTVFSREQGKLRAVAKGVRKIRSRRAGHLEPFTQVSLLLAKSKNLPIVTQADSLDGFLTLREDLTSIGYASYVCELLDKFTYEEEENISLYNVLRDTLQRLADPEIDHRLAVRYYEMRLLDYVGFRPDLFHCSVSGEEIQPEDQFFSAAQGGVVCPRDAHDPRGGEPLKGLLPISVDGLRFLRHFQRSSFQEAARARPSEEVHREMEILMQHYLTYTLERGLNTPKFMRQVRG